MIHSPTNTSGVVETKISSSSILFPVRVFSFLGFFEIFVAVVSFLKRAFCRPEISDFLMLIAGDFTIDN